MEESVQFVSQQEGAILPTRATPHSAGFDLYALENATIVGGQGMVVVRTGVGCSLPTGVYGRIAMRSGLAVRCHLAVGAGVIDSDYTGEIKILVYCTMNNRVQTISAGERFAQFIPEFYHTGVKGCVEKSAHEGFGSTGQF